MRECLALLLAVITQLPFERISEGGPIGPNGQEVQTYLPYELRLKNTGGMGPRGPGTGAGLCVFTSIEMSGKYQNEQRLDGFQKKMMHEPGGGYPEKVDVMIRRYANGTQYVQHLGGDIEFLRHAIAGGRMPCITYDGRDPHYRGTIAHMVNLVYLDDEMACIMDNNFIGEDEFIWLSADELRSRWLGTNGGWAVVLLNPPPPPVPTN